MAAFRRITVPNGASTTVYNKHLPFGRSDIIRVGVFGVSAQSYTVTFMIDETGVSHSVTNVMGTVVRHHVDVIFDTVSNIASVVINNQESVSVTVEVQSLIQDISTWASI